MPYKIMLAGDKELKTDVPVTQVNVSESDKVVYLYGRSRYDKTLVGIVNIVDFSYAVRVK